MGNVLLLRICFSVVGNVACFSFIQGLCHYTPFFPICVSLSVCFRLVCLATSAVLEMHKNVEIRLVILGRQRAVMQNKNNSEFPSNALKLKLQVTLLMTVMMQTLIVGFNIC